MIRQLGIIIGILFSLCICAGCEQVKGSRQQVEPAELKVYFPVRTDNPHLDDLDAVIAAFDSDGPGDAPEHVRWLPLHDVRQWLPEIEDAQIDLTVHDLPQYIATSRRLIAGSHHDGVYLLVHASPPKLPDGVEPTKSLTVVEATLGSDVIGRPAVDITLDEESGAWVAAVTTPHIGLPLAVVVDGEVYSTPVLRSQISRRLQIVGEMSDEQRRLLRNRLIGME